MTLEMLIWKPVLDRGVFFRQSLSWTDACKIFPQGKCAEPSFRGLKPLDLSAYAFRQAIHPESSFPLRSQVTYLFHISRRNVADIARQNLCHQPVDPKCHMMALQNSK